MVVFTVFRAISSGDISSRKATLNSIPPHEPITKMDHGENMSTSANVWGLNGSSILGLVYRGRRSHTVDIDKERSYMIVYYNT